MRIPILVSLFSSDFTPIATANARGSATERWDATLVCWAITTQHEEREVWKLPRQARDDASKLGDPSLSWP